MKRLVIIWHSQTGGSRQMAEAAASAARAESMDEHDSIDVHLIAAEAAGPDDLLSADACLLVFPENLAAISGVMKAFFDRSYYPLLGRIEGRAYALMVCAGSDGSNAVRQAQRIATGWRLRAVAEPLIVLTHAQSEAAILAAKTIAEPDLALCRERGAMLAAGLALGLF